MICRRLCRKHIGKRRCRKGKICLQCMHQSIYAAGCCGFCRNTHDQFRIENHICRKQMLARYRKLIIAASIRNDRKGSCFRAGARRRRHGYHGHNGPRYFAAALVLGNLSAICSQNGNRLCHIQRRTASECHYEIRSAFLISLHCPIYSFGARIAFRFRKSIAPDSGFFQSLPTGRHHPYFIQMRPRYYQRLAFVQLFCGFGELF